MFMKYSIKPSTTTQLCSRQEIGMHQTLCNRHQPATMDQLITCCRINHRPPMVKHSWMKQRVVTATPITTIHQQIWLRPCHRHQSQSAAVSCRVPVEHQSPPPHQMETSQEDPHHQQTRVSTTIGWKSPRILPNPHLVSFSCYNTWTSSKISITPYRHKISVQSKRFYL